MARALEEYNELERAFRARELLDERFYRQLEAHGCDVSSCFLIELIPDGGETYFGTLIRQDGRVYVFDLDLPEPTHSEWEDRTEQFVADQKRLRKSRPWDLAIVAYERFLAVGRRRPTADATQRPRRNDEPEYNRHLDGGRY